MRDLIRGIATPLAGAALVIALLGAAGAGAAEPALPAPRGFVTDLANVVPPDVEARITALAEELRAKTGAEIAVVTVPTTAPLDDFTYALRLAEQWKPGQKGKDNGIVFLVATQDRRMRIQVGYGLEGILPDGLVGELQDRVVVPAFRAGRPADGIWEGVRALAFRIAEAQGVALTGTPPPRLVRRGPAPVRLPGWVVIVVLIAFAIFVLYEASRPRRFRRRGRGPYYGGFPGWGGGGFGGNGGGGFGGFGGGSFGGGGAGRSW
jgi:uncharacterized protein